MTGRQPLPISSSELHTATAAYIDRVRSGESFAITRYGRPMAILLPPDLYEQLMQNQRPKKTT